MAYRLMRPNARELVLANTGTLPGNPERGSLTWQLQDLLDFALVEDVFWIGTLRARGSSSYLQYARENTGQPLSAR